MSRWDVSRGRGDRRDLAPPIENLSRCCAAPLIVVGEGRHCHLACSSCRRPATRGGRA